MKPLSSTVQADFYHQAKGIVLLGSVTFVFFVLFGQWSWGLVGSLLLGTMFAIGYSFFLMRNVEQALTLSPAQAARSMQKGYAKRYMACALYMVLMLKCPFFHPLAGILPVFFPRFALLFSKQFMRKGGKKDG